MINSTDGSSTCTSICHADPLEELICDHLENLRDLWIAFRALIAASLLATLGIVPEIADGVQLGLESESTEARRHHQTGPQ